MDERTSCFYCLQLFTQLIDTWLVHISLITLCIKYIVVAVLLKVKIEGPRAMPDTWAAGNFRPTLSIHFGVEFVFTLQLSNCVLTAFEVDASQHKYVKSQIPSESCLIGLTYLLIIVSK